MKLTAVIFPLALMGFSISKNFYLSLLCLCLVGWALVTFLALTNSSIQLRTSDNLRGRVMSAYTLVFIGLAPIGNLLLGASADYFGTPIALMSASAFCVVLSLILGTRIKESEI